MKKTFSIIVLALAWMGITTANAAITEAKGWLESAYAIWEPVTDATGYNVYVSSNGSDYSRIDNQLVRKYSTYVRADVLGLAEGSYTIKVVPVIDGSEDASKAMTTSSLAVKKHDHTGFAFMGKQTPSAYNADGTLKDNAVVIYVTNANKNTVSADITYSSKGVKQACTGLLAILTAYKKGYETRPVDIRLIGNIKGSDMNLIDFEDGTTTSIASAKDFKGDLMISSNGNDCGGFTIEGVGNDATANGFGIRLKSVNYCEVRNIGFMNCSSTEGDNVGLQQDNNYCWVHNCDMFYGNAGSDADQVKGDGALDCKLSNFITFSYNHFWDNGKCNLLGLSEGTKSYQSNPYFITYHHNWYDHSDSRHPRCRYYNAHVYNNYYDGNAKYGAGATLGASVYMEGNYFDNCQYVMMISMQGSDVLAGSEVRDVKDNPTFSKEDGGMIKAFNNYMTGNCTFIPYGATTYLLKGAEASIGTINSTADFDAYVVSSASETVPQSIVSYQGSNYYSNFDTNSSVMYSYSAQQPADAKATITGEYGAGRVQHGDFQWTFTAEDAKEYAVNEGLKSALTSYTTDFVGIAGGSFVNESSFAITSSASVAIAVGSTSEIKTTGAAGTVSYKSSDEKVATVSADGIITAVGAGSATITVSDSGSSDVKASSATISVTVSDGSAAPSGDNTICYFTGSKPSSSFVSVTGSYSTSKGSVTYSGTTYNTCVKMESSTSIKVTPTSNYSITLVFGGSVNASSKVFCLDGTKTTLDANGKYTFSGKANTTYTITKTDGINLFLILFNNTTGINSIENKAASYTMYDAQGRKINSPKKGQLYIMNGKKYIGK